MVYGQTMVFYTMAKLSYTFLLSRSFTLLYC